MFALGTFGSSAVFFLFLQLFDVCVIGSVVLDLTCASVFKNFASARGVKEVFGNHEKLKCRAYNILLASESHAWVSTPSSSWQQGRARPEGQTCRLQSRGDDHHDFEDLRHAPQKKDNLYGYVLDHCNNRVVHWRDTLAALLRNLSRLVVHSYGPGTNVNDLSRRILDDLALSATRCLQSDHLPPCTRSAVRTFIGGWQCLEDEWARLS